MDNTKTRPMTFRTSEEIRDDFKRTYEESGATSQNEFLGMLLKKWIEPKEINGMPPTSEPIEIPSILTMEEAQEVLKSSFEVSDASSIDEFLDQLLLNFNGRKTAEEKKTAPAIDQPHLLENEILFSLNPAQEFALRETVLSKKFAENQNDILDEKRICDFYSGDISTTPEFKNLCIRNVVLTEDMAPEQRELAILHNIVALLLNRFLIRLVHGDIYNKGVSKLRKNDLRAFVREHQQEIPFENTIRTLDSGLNKKDIVLSLSPVQVYALRETVLSKDNFAEGQNELIDSLIPENKPFLYFGNLFEPEFQLLWVKNIPLTDDMTPEQRESAIQHNMAAFLLNMFLTNFVEENIDDSKATASSLKSFIQEFENMDNRL